MKNGEMEGLLSYKPYSYKAKGNLWWRTYFIMHEDHIISTVSNKADAKSIVSLLNGAFLVGVSTAFGLTSVYSS